MHTLNMLPHLRPAKVGEQCLTIRSLSLGTEVPAVAAGHSLQEQESWINMSDDPLADPERVSSTLILFRIS